ncbi:response regulator [Natrinema sp. 1APR25-10V2]|uniref:ATP-binding response regulator n=1 Tax=Natrinema sp. 1APR25-10V2 TaxID=2951081 RepID=UPI002875E256|nr:response regulator [Natrinema sp. 1APR25-10V2]MDS0476649.1 response regulator [Natrinema sp. 1APR25-10V2]
MPPGIHVLCVDDDPDARELLATVLERTSDDIDATTANSAAEGLAVLDDDATVDCIVSDYDIPEMNGLEFLDAARARDPEIPFLLVTGKDPAAIASEALAAGVTDYCRKGGTAQYELIAHRIERAVEQRNAERELRESERELARLEQIVDLAPTALFILDADATIVWCNAEFADAFTEERAELVGMAFPELVERGYYDERVTTRYADEVRGLLSSHTDRDRAKYQVQFRSPDGGVLTHDVHTELLPLDDGAFTGTIHAIRDVTRRRRYRRELERQNERLEEFATVVSHDLRNPLNVAQGHLERLESSLSEQSSDGSGDGYDGDAEGVLRASVGPLRRAFERMDELIEDLLSLARHGRSVDDPEPVDLPSLVREAWDVVDTADATLDCSVDGTISADAGRVKALFENLFRNAIEHGGSDVTVTVGPLEAGVEDHPSKTGFYVADDGPGLEADADEIFEFGRTTAADGTGFGLAIVEGVAEAHGWTVTAYSDESGTRFEVRGVTVPRDVSQSRDSA